ncbi:hypothetical protein [Thiomicrorhabdus indica]|uniref:hypothetical protein n=1 Tax=Thiomicrorhabdus indica TaxID=2267253 RepID=UPI0013EEA928|nr:hypothetical protein [Thiomicrorhabdus indica]
MTWSLAITTAFALLVGLGLFAFGMHLHKIADEKERQEKEFEKTFSNSENHG